MPLKLYLPLILAFQFPHTAQTPPSPIPPPSLCFPYKDWPGHFLSFSVGGGGLVCEHGQVRRITAPFFCSEMSGLGSLLLGVSGCVHRRTTAQCCVGRYQLGGSCLPSPRPIECFSTAVFCVSTHRLGLSLYNNAGLDLRLNKRVNGHISFADFLSL